MTTPHSADALKPCPFCGGQPKIHAKELDERYAYANEVKVQCSSCGVSVTAVGDTSKPGYADNSTTEKRAIAAWNRRPTPASDLCADLNAERINTTPASPGLDNEAAARLRKQAEEAKKVRGVVALSPEDAFALLDCLEREEADVAALRKEHDSYQRMFTAACEDLGAINEALNLDPNDGGAEPILEAIKELREHAEVVLSGFANSESPNNNAEFGVAAAGAVPEGFALVPVEPTDAMMLAAVEKAPIVIREHYARDGKYTGTATSLSSEMFGDAYRSMIAAAPPAQGLPAAPKFDQAKFNAMVKRGTEAWKNVADNWLEVERGNEPAAAPSEAKPVACVQQMRQAGLAAPRTCPTCRLGPCQFEGRTE